MPEQQHNGGRSALGNLLEASLAPAPVPQAPTVPPQPPAQPPEETPVAGPAAQAGAHPGSGAGDVGAVETLPGVLPISWEAVGQLRKQASEAIEAERAGRVLSEEDEQQLARAVISRVVAEWSKTHMLEHEPLTREQTAAVREAVFDAMYRAGAVQRLLDDPGVENIKIYGDKVRVKYRDRPTRTVPPIADSDDGLVRWVNEMASHSGHGERQLAQGRPETNFRLRDGSRVAASLLTARPAVTIRRHSVLYYTLQDLINSGTIDPVLAQFLASATKAKMSIIFAGDMGTGKTTLLRSTARTIPAEEDIATLETDYELYLDRMPDGPDVLPFEARESGGERMQDGRALGERTIADIFPSVLRHDVSRVIVGEVRGPEVFAMLDAMSAGGAGSMCTLHAKRYGLVLERLLFLCHRAGLSEAAAARLISTSVDFIVYLRRIDNTARGGQRHGFVSHVLETSGLGERGMPTFNEIFAPAGNGRADPRAVPRQTPSPQRLEELAGAGFDRQLMLHQHGMWPRWEVA